MKRRQRGFIGITGKDLIVAALIIGVCGWAVIEGLLWVASHFTIGWKS